MARSNGGIIGKKNQTSFGKITTVKTSSADSAATTQPGTRLVDYAVIGGAGSGGNNVGGGGGSGGVVYRQNIPVCGNTALGAVVIGAGGTAPVSPGNNQGTNGADSTFVIEGGTVTAKGGGGGGGLGGPGNDPGPVEVAQAGGSGGGAASRYPPGDHDQSGGATTQGSQPGISGSSGFGFAGGNSNSTCCLYSGGGGGAGAIGVVGNNCSPEKSGDGGAGKNLSGSFGTAVGVCGVFAGGGGGGHYTDAKVGIGGSGGGGVGGGNNNPNKLAVAGTANTGSGGGGVAGLTSNSTTKAGNGGSGVVIVKELDKASGVWNLRSQFAARKQGIWPKLTLSYDLNYLVVAGGGGGPGGGAGGYRTSGFGPSPLRGSALTFSGIEPGATFPVTIGAGGGAKGSASTFSPAVNTITSAGGGDGASATSGCKTGGSGGGARVYPPEGAIVQAGAGNTPPTDPSQGNAGGSLTFTGSIGPQGGATIGFSGGGGATAAAAAVTFANNFTLSSGSLNGGAGAPNVILGPDTSYAGGGGGFLQSGASFVAAGCGGAGGGAPGNSGCLNGAANTGGGGGSRFGVADGEGGSGIVVIRGPSARTFAVSPCTNAISTHPGGDKIAKFTVSGVLTVT